MKLIKILFVLFVVFSACKTLKGGTHRTIQIKKALTSKIDSVSYAIGISMGEQMRINREEIDSDLFIQGYLNGRDSSNFLIPSKNTRSLINKYFKKRQAEIKRVLKEKREKEFSAYKKQGEQFLAKNKAKEGVKTTESGLQYLILKEGKGEAPKKTDRVKVNYHGTLIDGTVFDSSIDRGKPSEFKLNHVIKGWTEGLQLMKPGAKYKFFIPQELGYGSKERGQKIKPFSLLIFEVELLEVK